MKPGARIEIIKTLSDRLAVLEWPELDLTLRQFGFTWSDEWEGDNKSYALPHLEMGEDKILHELSGYFFWRGRRHVAN